MSTKKLYIGNLPSDVTEEGLVAHFGPYGGANPHIVGRRNFGFIDVDEDRMRAAIAERDGALLDGKELTINEATHREVRRYVGTDSPRLS